MDTRKLNLGRLTAIVVCLTVIILAGCTDLDDVYRRLDNQKEELANIKALANAVTNKLSVVSYKELPDKSGYELTMSDGSKIILKHGNKGSKGDRGNQGDQGDQGNPGSDANVNLTITETADGIIIEYNGENYVLPKLPMMTFTTAKSMEETLELWIGAAEADRSGVWIDLNNNGKKDDGEAVTKFGKFVEYTLGAQTVTVYGKVTVLNCENNQLTSLNVSNNTVLTFLDCSSNQLSSLEVSNNKKLEKLYCRSNQLTSLDISNNKELEILWCNNNQLTTLNVSNNVKLWFLSCHDNQLTSLDVSKNTLFEQLFCYNNKISGANMTALVNSLPDRNDKEEGKFGVFDIESDTEQNVITAAQAAVATGKNWIVQDSDGNPYTPGS